jgi:DNA invertase Pin-like site-specific DNA recombinase
MELDGYIRVSAVRGRSGESFISPDVQREQVERWAAMRGVTIAQWHTDLDETGGVLSRPGLDAMMERIRSGATGGVAVARLDRLSRAGVADALKLVEEIHERGGKLAAVDLGIDPTTPFGEFALTVMLGLARMQRRQIADSWATAQERAVARGVHIASKPPTGYLRDEAGRLVVDVRFREAVAEAFRIRARGGSWREISEHLNAHAVESPYGPTNWHTGSVQHIIGNRAYLGEARSGRHTNADAHEAITDAPTFEAAQVAGGPSPTRSANPALLAGLIRCASCRYAMKPDKMTLRNGERARIYRCRGEHAGGRCENKVAVLASVIEPHVEREFFEAVGLLEAEPVISTEAVEEAVRALEAAEADLVTFRDNERIIGALGPDRYVEGLEVRARAADDARARLAEIAGDQASDLPPRATLEGMWADLDVRERQHLLRSVLDAVFVRPGRGIPIERRSLLLTLGQAPDDLPGRGRKPGPIRALAWPDEAPRDAGVAVA